MLYIHTWEFDLQTPLMPLPWLRRFRTYTGIKHSSKRLDRLLRQPGHWSPIAEILDEIRDKANHRPVFDLNGSWWPVVLSVLLVFMVLGQTPSVGDPRYPPPCKGGELEKSHKP